MRAARGRVETLGISACWTFCGCLRGTTLRNRARSRLLRWTRTSTRIEKASTVLSEDERILNLWLGVVRRFFTKIHQPELLWHTVYISSN
jgi:hypothetical protein